MALQITVLILKSGLIFHQQVEENECSILFLLQNSCSFSKSKENRFSNVCHSSQPPHYKNTFSPNSSNQNDFFKKIGWYTFFLLYLWAKYELIWSDITAQTVTLGANLLVMAQTIPQNAHRVFFFKPKVAFTEDI